jgi:HSP20 family protein
MSESKEIQVKEKQELATPAEQTKTGPVFVPAVDIYETEAAIVVAADMPGVDPQDINIDLRDDVLTISGDVKPFENAEENDVLVEFEVGRYFRQFTLTETIDQERIEASHQDGVLHLNLPKQAKALPRKITVSAS